VSENDVTPSESPDSAPKIDVSGGPIVMIGPTWQEQDILLRDLWTQNKTPQEISDQLGRSIAAIMTRAARLGLPRRSAPGRKPGSHRILQRGEVRVTTPRPASLKTQESKDSPPQPSTRICLMCLRPFPSLGRHNRICPSCKSSAEYESAVALSDINLPV
jgi:hypothetical protein